MQAAEPSPAGAAATPAGHRLFVSYAATDREWAEWIAWQLEAAGYLVELQAWDFHPGQHFIERMDQALERADRVVAVLSEAYLASPYASEEWRATLPRGRGEPVRLLPVRVAACTLPPLLSGRIYIDLVLVDEAEATRRLRRGVAASVKGMRGKPAVAPAFPGRTDVPAAGTQPLFPGVGPAISNLPPRNPHFTGRAGLLGALEERLKAGGSAALVAAHGLGGVGKTQLALEYAHQHANEYELVWWVAADTTSPIITGMGELAPRLGLAVEPELEATAAGVVEALGRRPGWLLVFDNAEDPQVVGRFLPAGTDGQVLVTSRNPAFGQLGARVEVEVLPAEEAVAFLLARSSDTDWTAAAELAGELGGLPLALAQAAAYCEQTSIDLAGYLARYRRRQRELLTRGALAGYPETVATTWRLNLEEVQARTPAAVELLRLCAFLAPDEIPLELLAAAPAVLPAALGNVVADELATDELVAALHRFSLVRRDRSGLGVHRLVQGVIRDSMNADQACEWTERAVRLVLAALPEHPDDPGSWPRYAAVLAHAKAAADHAQARNGEPEPIVGLLNRIGIYLTSRTELAAAAAVLDQALAIAEATFGPDHPAVATTLVNLGGVLGRRGEPTGARQRLERAVAIFEAAYGPEDPAVATALSSLGHTLYTLGEPTGARQQLKRALEILESAYGPNHPEVAATLDSLSLVLRELGELPAARHCQERALAIFEAANGPDHPRVAITLMSLGQVLQELGELPAAREQLERAVAVSEAAYGPDHIQVASTVGSLGHVLQRLGELAAARQCQERALAIFEAAYDRAHPHLGATVGSLGIVLYELGELPAAREQLERAVAVSEAAYGPDHIQVASMLGALGIVLRELGELPAAREQLERALAIEEGAGGPDHSKVAVTLGSLGGVLRELGELPSAREQLERALAIEEATYGPEHIQVASTLGALGNVLRELGELPAARKQLERALALVETAYGPDHSEVARVLTNFGIVLVRCGDLAGARYQFQRVLAIEEAAYGPDHPEVAVTLGNLGSVLSMLGDLAGARKCRDRALMIFRQPRGQGHEDTQ